MQRGVVTAEAPLSTTAGCTFITGVTTMHAPPAALLPSAAQYHDRPAAVPLTVHTPPAEMSSSAVVDAATEVMFLNPLGDAFMRGSIPCSSATAGSGLTLGGATATTRAVDSSGSLLLCAVLSQSQRYSDELVVHSNPVYACD